jgi:hypothetical protein
MTIITFSPLLLVLFFIAKFIFSSFRGNTSKNPEPDKSGLSVYSHLSSFGSNRINKLSFKLLLVEFMVPLSLGILAAVQENDLLYGLMKISDFWLLAILPIIIALGYHSLYSNISSKNQNFSGTELNRTAFKIYGILFFQAWIITVALLNILARYVFIDSTTYGTDWKQLLTVGKIVNFAGLDYLIFPAGSLIITFISLFIGLFVESFNMKQSEKD